MRNERHYKELLLSDGWSQLKWIEMANKINIAGTIRHNEFEQFLSLIYKNKANQIKNKELKKKYTQISEGFFTGEESLNKFNYNGKEHFLYVSNNIQTPTNKDLVPIIKVYILGEETNTGTFDYFFNKTD